MTRTDEYLASEVLPWLKLYNMNLPSTRGGLFYNTFAYPTKISPESIAVYIAMHTKPGDTILDVFGGSGSTGIAALMCEHPTESMELFSRKFNLNPEWGARNAILYEIGKYGAFASQVMANPPAQKEFTDTAKKLLNTIDTELSLYSTLDAEGNPSVIRHVIYSDIYSCCQCGKEFTYFEGMVRYNPLRIDGEGICPHCGSKRKSSEFSNVIEEVYDELLGKFIQRRKRVPVRVYGQTGLNKWVREADDIDIEQINSIDSLNYPHNYKAQEIVWGELYRSGYHQGISHLHHFYTKRNFLVMYSLWERAGEFKPRVRDAIRLLLLSYNAAHATLMTRVVVKKNSKDFVLTSAQSGVLYISSLPVEKNIISGIRRKLKSFEEAFTYLSTCSGHIDIINSSSTNLTQKDNSIDYIFTDPPFGDFIPYAEVNQINELWLGKPTNRSEEIIISQSQKKNVSCYQKMMTEVFTEMNRVLKKDAFATIVFHASKAMIWNALSKAYSDAGFFVEAVTSLEKSQASFKQIVSKGSVQGDPLILISKGKGECSSLHSQTILDEIIDNNNLNTTKSERQIYAKYVSKCLELGVSIDFDAKKAYAYIASKIETIKGHK